MGDDHSDPDSGTARGISIHIPRVGDDQILAFTGLVDAISIHIPRVGDDVLADMIADRVDYDFNPHPPCGG